MAWTVEFHAAFAPEVLALRVKVRREMLAQATVLELFGPEARRPRVDTLSGSKHANMKELRFDADGGASLSPSILSEKRCCSSLATSRASARGNSTNG